MTNLTDGSLHQNLEFKAPAPSPERTRQALQDLGARDHGLLLQTDHYVAVPHGRLKLRIIEGQGAQLIAYDRPESDPQRQSRFRITPVSDPGGLLAVLSAALDLRGSVIKRRRLFLWNECRIHLDEVEGLGAFLEFEVRSRGDAADDAARMQRLMTAFGLRDSDGLQASYSDMLGF